MIIINGFIRYTFVLVPFSLQQLNPPTAKSSQQLDIYHVRGALIAAIEKYLKVKSVELRTETIDMLKNEIEEKDAKPEEDRKGIVKSETTPPPKPNVDVNRIYQDAYHHFGSSLASRSVSLSLTLSLSRSLALSLSLSLSVFF